MLSTTNNQVNAYQAQWDITLQQLQGLSLKTRGKCWEECGEKGTVGGMEVDAIPLENSGESSKKKKEENYYVI